MQLLFVLIFHFRLLIQKKKELNTALPPVSIVICARNEEDNLYEHLPKILEQDYPQFEVIIVIDQTVDDSVHIIRAFQKDYPQLRCIEMERNRHRQFGKKLPLTVGIKGAAYDKILLIDADCYPQSDQWIRKMISNYTTGKEIVLGYGPYETKKGWLNKFIRFDTAVIAMNYLSFAKSGRPYMAVGRNLSYSKKRWLEVDGFKKHYHVPFLHVGLNLFLQDHFSRFRKTLS